MMNPEQKLAFISSMTDKALQHVASTPSVAAPNGGMSHDKMLSFVTAMTKNGLQHFDAGGVAAPGVVGVADANPIMGSPNTQTTGVVGAVGNAIGTNNQFQGQAAPIQAGTNATQINQAYQGAQGALGTQGNITSTLNQGLNQGANQQSALSQMYLNQAQGIGPNPAQAALNQNTGANVAQQAALQASQRGASANAGLIAREAGQQGAAIQQQAVGQAATQQAQQQLAAEQNLQNLSANQVAQGTTATQGLNNAQQNEQNIIQGSNTAYNNANVSQQSNLNNVNAQVAVGNQQSASNTVSGIGGALTTGALAAAMLFEKGGMVSMDKGGKVLDANARAHIAPHNFALPGGRYPIHDIAHARNALARVSQNGTPEEKSKVKSAVAKKYPGVEQGKKMACGGYAEGGNVTGENVAQDRNQVEQMPWVMAPRMMASGGGVGITGEQTSGPQSYVGQWLNSATNTQNPMMSSQNNIPQVQSGNPLGALNTLAGQIPAPSSGGNASSYEPYTNITDPAADNPGGGWGVSDLSQAPMSSNITEGLEAGGNVRAKNPSQKAVKKGDSLKNDKVPAMLSEGELVVDRDTLADPGPIGQMARAVAHHISQRNKK